jgi:hypothetical protein
VQIENSTFAGVTLMSARGSGVKKGSSKGGRYQGPTCQRCGNWEQVEVLVFIQCKHAEHVAQKWLTNPRAHMVLAV